MACKTCGDEGQIIVPVSTSCDQAIGLENGSCQSFSGKFYDKTIADFTVPTVGKIGLLSVCEANLWSACQFVGVCIGKSKYAFFRITETGQHILKILNGCEKGNPDAGIAGNPEPGIVIPEGSTIFPCPPVGCSNQLAQEFASLLDNYGADGVIKILKESDEICFTSTPELDEVETAHLFGGTFVDCDCADPPATFLSCLRKILKVFTGQSGKTLCMPQVGTTSDADVTIDDVPISKYLAYFDEKGCLKKGRKTLPEADPPPQVLMALSANNIPGITTVKTTYALTGVPVSATHAIINTVIGAVINGPGSYAYVNAWAYYGDEQQWPVLIERSYNDKTGDATNAGIAVVPIIDGMIALHTDGVSNAGPSSSFSINIKVVGYIKL